MKLLVKKLWLRPHLDDILDELFSVPPIREMFQEGHTVQGEMKPRGIKICPGYWPAEKILQRLPSPGQDLYLILTSLELKGDCGRIHSRGQGRKAIVSTSGYTNGFGTFKPGARFYETVMGAIGVSLGLKYHTVPPASYCAMTRELHDPKASMMGDLQFCDECTSTLSQKP